MRIVDVDVEVRRMGLRRPYEVAYGRFEHVENVFVTLTDGEGRVGRGVAAPEPEVTGESVQAVVAGLQGPADAVLRASDPRDRPGLLARLDLVLPDHPALRAAVELALVDLLLGLHGLDLQAWLGRSRASVPVGATVGIVDVDETVRRARARVAAGAVQLKIKGGHDVDEDLARLHAVRGAVGPDVALWFDANQGYDVAGALRLATGAGDLVALIEQPTPADDLDALAAVTRASPVPVIADESVQSPADALDLVSRRAAHGVNVKLMKLGGLSACRDVAAIARAGGLGVMVGCMDESALSIAGGVALACAIPGRVWADLDGDLDLLDDPYAGLVVREGGRVRPGRG